MARGYGLDGRVSIPDKARDFSLFHSFQNGSDAHPVSWVPEAFSLGVRQPWR
jgi:hypothetical protein